MSVISQELKLDQNSDLKFGVTATVDDSNLCDPHAYDHMGKTYRRFNRKVTISNTGSTPIFGMRITTNNGDLSSFENLKTHLRLEPNVSRPKTFAIALNNGVRIRFLLN